MGTQSSGVVRRTPVLRPGTVSITLGSPAMSRIVTRPRVACCSRLSVHTICGSSRGIHEIAPMRTATGVISPMGAG